MVSVTTSSSSVQDGTLLDQMHSIGKDDNDYELWEVIVQEQCRREQQRRRMVRWRVQKKNKMAAMHHERQKLEKELRRRLADVRDQVDFPQSNKLSAQQAFRQISIESAALKSENLSLQEALRQHATFQGFVRREAGDVDKHDDDSLQLMSSKDVLATHQDTLGWRIFFPNHEPSFHFHPFSKAEFDDLLKQSVDNMTKNDSCVATIGKLFGWTVDYAPLAPARAGSSLMAHARFSRRLHISLDQIQRILPHTDKNTWPMVVSPRSWGQLQQGEFCCQAAQSFDENSLVLVCNISGIINLRYLAMAQYKRENNSDGKRMDTYSIAITNSERNIGSQDHGESQNNVKWITEGGTFFIFTEVDETTTDVAYHHWAGCLNEALGRELYIDWIRFAVVLEQYVSPARLLTTSSSGIP